MATLQIQVKRGAEGVLAGFPFTDEEVQFVSGEFEVDGKHYVEVALADLSDTTRAMEQFLDTNPNVIRYDIK